MKAVREAIWESVRSGTRDAIAAVVPGVRVGCEATGGTIRLVAAGDTVETVVTELVLDICDADRAGTFGRLKSCAPLPLGLLRHLEEPDREVVLDAGLWRPGEGQGVPATPVERS